MAARAEDGGNENIADYFTREKLYLDSDEERKKFGRGCCTTGAKQTSNFKLNSLIFPQKIEWYKPPRQGLGPRI